MPVSYIDTNAEREGSKIKEKEKEEGSILRRWHYPRHFQVLQAERLESEKCELLQNSKVFEH